MASIPTRAYPIEAIGRALEAPPVSKSLQAIYDHAGQLESALREFSTTSWPHHAAWAFIAPLSKELIPTLQAARHQLAYDRGLSRLVIGSDSLPKPPKAWDDRRWGLEHQRFGIAKLSDIVALLLDLRPLAASLADDCEHELKDNPQLPLPCASLLRAVCNASDAFARGQLLLDEATRLQKEAASLADVAQLLKLPEIERRLRKAAEAFAEE